MPGVIRANDDGPRRPCAWTNTVAAEEVPRADTELIMALAGTADLRG